MAITSATYEILAGRTYLFTATSDAATPTYYWYRDGVLVQADARNTFMTLVFDGNMDIQVFDSGATSPNPAYPLQATVQWSPSDYGTARRYIVRHAVSPYTTETDLGVVYDVGETPVLTFTTDPLDTGEQRIYVYPVDEHENEGLPTVFHFAIRGSSGIDTTVAISYELATTTLTGASA